MPALRSAVNWTLISLGILQSQLEQKHFHPRYFDIGTLPLPHPHYKAYRQPRDPGMLDMGVIHVTGVRRGFGTSKRQRKKWLDRMRPSEGGTVLETPITFEPLGLQLQVAGTLLLRGMTPDGVALVWKVLDTPERLAHRLALWERLRKTPYHHIAVLRAGDVLANRGLHVRTKHGNGGNRGVGLAFDMSPKEQLTDDMIATGQHALHTLADRMTMWRRTPTIVKLTSHRQHKFPGRANDPGMIAARKIVLPVVRARDDLVIAHGLTTGSGRPWPSMWDPESPYDLKGRRIDGRNA